MTALRVLLIEDDVDDAALIERELRLAGFTVALSRIDDATGAKAAVAEGPWDIVLADHVLPGFGSHEAYQVLRGAGLDVPFVIVSGRIGEEAVADALRQGAAEYVNKDNLAALGPAVRRCLLTSAAERERHAAEERFRLAFEDAPTGIALVSLEGRWLRVNRALCTLTRYSEEELLQRTFQDITHPDDLGADLEIMRGLLAGEAERYELEKRYLRSDGSTVWILLSASLVHDPGGEPRYFVAHIQDIDARRRSDARFRGLVQSAPDAMVIIDRLGKITLVNRKAGEMFGYSPEELIGEPVELLVPERVADGHRNSRAAYTANPHPRAMGEGLELSARTADGREFPVEISLSPLDTDEGLLISAAIRDVTERKRAERVLTEANQQLENANRAMTRFLTSMSHELRTPLNAMLGFTGTLLMGHGGPLTETHLHQLRTIQSSGQHLLSLINDLLDLSRIESGKMHLSPTPVEPERLAGEVADNLRALGAEKGLTLTLEPSAPWTIQADRRAVQQILINLVGNAIKFTKTGGIRVRVEQRVEDAVLHTRFEVVDTGYGIREADRAKLFAAFEQIGDVETRPYEGTGLGLFISQTLARMMGSTITFSSVWGEGSTFGFDLSEPVSTAPATPA
jgi:protein-histidine pros-kinase